MPAPLPGHRTRAQRFDDIVLDAVEDLEGRWHDQLERLEFAVEDVPAPPSTPTFGRGLPSPPAFGDFFPGTRSERGRVVIYRRPLETRASDEADLAALVHDIVVENVASALGLTPEQIDPSYGDE